jgi:thioredoxin 2
VASELLQAQCGAVIRTCTACGRLNRIPPERLADTGRCGACKAPLPPPGEPIDVDEALFDEITRGAKVPILVDFWAEWCGPCRMAASEVKQVAAEMASKALVLKIDADKHPALSARFGVRALPHFIVMRGGQATFQQPGLVRSQQMIDWLRQAAAA